MRCWGYRQTVVISKEHHMVVPVFCLASKHIFRVHKSQRKYYNSYANIAMLHLKPSLTYCYAPSKASFTCSKFCSKPIQLLLLCDLNRSHCSSGSAAGFDQLGIQLQHCAITEIPHYLSNKLLINEIVKRPLLWNVSRTDYHKTIPKSLCWLSQQFFFAQLLHVFFLQNRKKGVYNTLQPKQLTRDTKTNIGFWYVDPVHFQ